MHTFSGLAHARIESRLSFRVRGTILRVPVRMGDTVRAGQLIAELDPTVYQVQLQEAQAGLVQAQAEARNAEANYERVRALFENENASLNELDTARAGTESTAALVRSVEKRLELCNELPMRGSNHD